MTTRRFFFPPDDQPPRLPAPNRLNKVVPFLLSQLVLFLVAFQVYKMARKMFIPNDEAVAYDNAHDIIHLQQQLGLFFELDLQRWVLDQGTWLITIFNNFYAYYMWGFYVCMLFLALMSPARYRYMRRAFFISMAFATPMYLIYPLAPPRFMGQHGWPFIDTLSVYGPNYFSDTGLVTANRLAAMPSMHVGWTTFAAICLMLALPWRRVGLALCILITVMMATTVMVTGNHYWLDGVGGWLIITAALIVNRLLPYPLPIRWPWQRTAPVTAADQPSVSTSRST
jgi:membrane-associated phospholipid phosphatase